MRANHIPVVERLKHRIRQLESRADINHVKSPYKGNPYWCCKVCGIHDPELSIRRGKHFSGCTVGGIPREVDHYKALLEAAKNLKPIITSRCNVDNEIT